MLADLRLAWRALRRSPGYLLAAVCTLALGVGLNTALFSVVNAVLLKPLPYRAPEQLVGIDIGGPSTAKAVARTMAERTANVFSGVAYASNTPGDATLGGAGAEPARVTTVVASANLFDVLGVGAARGRALRAGDDQLGRDRVVVLSDRLWRTRLRADPAVVGRSVTIDGVPREVVGVMPPGFAYPSATVDVWAPATLDPQNVGDYWFMYYLRPIARLRDGVTVERARAVVRAAVPGVRAAIPWHMPDDWGKESDAAELRESVVGGAGATLWVLWGAVSVLLAAACVNAANLALARAAGRAREAAVRAAVGASRARLVRVVLAEHVLLAAVAGAVGALVAVAATRGLVALLPADLPRADEVRVDGRVLAFALAAATLASLAAGLVPALRASRPALAGVLGGSSRGASAGRERRRAADALVVAQLALAVLLAAGAGLLGRSVARLLAERPGFRPESAAAVALTLPSFAGDSLERGRAYYDRVLERVRALPGVRAAGITSALPIDREGGGASGVMTVEAHPTPPGAVPPEFDWFVVTPDYVRAAGIPLRAGRAFGAEDDAQAAGVVLVDSAAAARYWPGERVIGRRVQMITGGAWLTVAGVVGSVKRDGLDAQPRPTIYFPVAQNSDLPKRARLVVRGDASALAGTGLAALRAVVRGVDASAPVGAPRPLADYVTESAGRQRFAALLATLFAGAALVLGAVGVYGVVAYATAARARELGVRAALGATAGDLRVLVLADGGRLALWGTAAGLVAALAGGRLIRGLLYNVSPGDPVVLAGVPLLLAAVTVAASLLPARRAGRVNPAVALRAE